MNSAFEINASFLMSRSSSSNGEVFARVGLDVSWTVGPMTSSRKHQDTSFLISRKGRESFVSLSQSP